MGRQFSSICMAAKAISGLKRQIPNGVEIELQRGADSFCVRLQEQNDSVVLISVWNGSFLFPEDPNLAAYCSFYMQTVNLNSASGRMTWNEDGHCIYAISVVATEILTERTLLRVVEETLDQMSQAWPGLRDVRNGMDPSVAMIRNLDRFQCPTCPLVRPGSSEITFLQRCCSAASFSTNPIDGGVTFDWDSFRIELTADVSGRFRLQAKCNGFEVPHKGNLSTTFYLAIANANGSNGTMYVSDVCRPASRFEIFANGSSLPGEPVILYTLMDMVWELDYHIGGLQNVIAGADIMESYNDAARRLSDHRRKAMKER